MERKKEYKGWGRNKEDKDGEERTKIGGEECGWSE
jgi:hypothetical protein